MRPRSSQARKWVVCGTVVLLALFCLTVGSGVAGQRAGNAKPVYWGATIGPQITGEAAPWDIRPVRRLERKLGKRFSVVGFSQPFSDCAGPRCVLIGFPLTPLENARRHGSIPFFSWSSAKAPGGRHQPAFQLRDLIRGRYDRFIRSFAIKAREWGHPFFLRFNWEMNGDWFSWSEGVNGNRRGQYVRAWRHVHRIFDSVSAHNATWVWCPNIYNDAGLRSLYPGSAYVDWTCLDGFNWGPRSGSSGWTSFDQLFRHSYRRLLRIAPRKPMILGEVASTSIGGDKAAWIRHMLRRIPRAYPKIRGFLWFDVHDRGTDWPLETSRRALRAFRRDIRRPVYVGGRYRALEGGRIRPEAAFTPR